MEFEIINGGASRRIKLKKEKMKIFMSKWHELYMDYKYGFEHDVDKLKAVYFGIKYYSKLNVDELDYRKLLVAFSEFCDIKTMMSTLTYRELMSVFTIIKEFDGKKYECKDYYTTLEYLADKNLDGSIGYNEIETFLWNYYNHDIMNFSVKEMLVMDRMMKYESGGFGLFERFLADTGLDKTIHTYTMDKENNLMIDNNTGETFKIEKPKPHEAKYFEIIERKDKT